MASIMIIAIIILNTLTRHSKFIFGTISMIEKSISNI